MRRLKLYSHTSVLSMRSGIAVGLVDVCWQGAKSKAIGRKAKFDPAQQIFRDHQGIEVLSAQGRCSRYATEGLPQTSHSPAGFTR